jgi:phi LC3 family holin
MKINWKVRFLSVKFWLALVPAILLVGQAVAAVFGYNWDFASLGKELTGVINAVFAVLAILGVVTDPTTAGVNDSAQALTYSRPAKDIVPDPVPAEPLQANGQGQLVKDTLPDVSAADTTANGADSNVVQH